MFYKEAGHFSQMDPTSSAQQRFAIWNARVGIGAVVQQRFYNV
jgi:hypothetical protein